MLNVALKEWCIVCDLLLQGKLAIVLRKGGISEPGGAGVFELEHSRFALWPSWAHQLPDRIKSEHRDRVEVLDEPFEQTITGIADAVKIWEVPSRAAFDSLDDLHCWTKPQIDMRFDYKPEKPLYLMALRAWRLTEPKTVLNVPDYAGCRSWVPLAQQDAVDDNTLIPSMDDDQYESILNRVSYAMQG